MNKIEAIMVIIVIGISIGVTIIAAQANSIEKTFSGEVKGSQEIKFHINEGQTLEIYFKLSEKIGITILDEWNYALYKKGLGNEVKEYFTFDPKETNEEGYYIQKFTSETPGYFYIMIIGPPEEMGIYDIKIKRNFGF